MSSDSFSPGLPMMAGNLPTPKGLVNFGMESGSYAPLIAWVLSEAYSLTSATRDSDGVITAATVSWPDGSTGTFTSTAKNSIWLVIDAYTVTHSTSGKTVTQAAVTRDSNGNITAQPSLAVA